MYIREREVNPTRQPLQFSVGSGGPKNLTVYLRPPMVTLTFSSRGATEIRVSPEGNVAFVTPSGLVHVDVRWEDITELDVSVNQLTSLPPLPRGLLKLTCERNRLSSLPPCPEGLLVLSCGYNCFSSEGHGIAVPPPRRSQVDLTGPVRDYINAKVRQNASAAEKRILAKLVRERFTENISGEERRLLTYFYGFLTA